MLFIS